MRKELDEKPAQTGVTLALSPKGDYFPTVPGNFASGYIGAALAQSVRALDCGSEVPRSIRGGCTIFPKRISHIFLTALRLRYIYGRYIVSKD